jgi:Zn-finger protein
MSAHYKFNQHLKCEFFPCHKGIETTEFNCLFCYCPLYMLKSDCGGDYKINHGVKDCSDCKKPHDKASYSYVMSKIKMVIERGSDF